MSKKLGETSKVTAGIAPGTFAAGDLTPIVIDRYAFEDAIVHLKVGAAAGTPTAQSVALKMQTGDIIPISIPDKIVANVDNIPLMECRYGQQGGQYALKIERFVTMDNEEPTLGAQNG